MHLINIRFFLQNDDGHIFQVRTYTIHTLTRMKTVISSISEAVLNQLQQPCPQNINRLKKGLVADFRKEFTNF